MAIPFFDLTRQYVLIEKEINDAIAQILKSTQFILGSNVSKIESHVAAYCGVNFGVGVASGTDALHLALKSCGVNAGDEVITTPFTFVATIEAIMYIGAKPVFVDIDHKTFNIDHTKIEEKITPKTKAIIPIHLFGRAANMTEIMRIAKDNNLKVVEDACQGIGAEHNGMRACSFGDAGALSFFPTKNLGCFGDGGMIITNNEKIACEIKILRNHGSSATYMYDEIGFNSRLDELQAAVLMVKLKYLEDAIRARINNANQYDSLLINSDVITPAPDDMGRHVYNQYTIRAPKRIQLKEYLRLNGINSMVYYPRCLHLHKAYKHLGYHMGDFPNSEKAQDEVLSLPIFPELTRDEILEVCVAVKKFYLG